MWDVLGSLCTIPINAHGEEGTEEEEVENKEETGEKRRKRKTRRKDNISPTHNRVSNSAR